MGNRYQKKTIPHYRTVLQWYIKYDCVALLKGMSADCPFAHENVSDSLTGTLLKRFQNGVLHEKHIPPFGFTEAAYVFLSSFIANFGPKRLFDSIDFAIFHSSDILLWFFLCSDSSGHTKCNRASAVASGSSRKPICPECSSQTTCASGCSATIRSAASAGM